MKTIQETLRELDAKEVIDYYIMKHPGNIYRENKRRPKSMTIEEYKERRRSKVQSLIDRLLSLTPNVSVSENNRKCLILLRD